MSEMASQYPPMPTMTIEQWRAERDATVDRKRESWATRDAGQGTISIIREVVEPSFNPTGLDLACMHENPELFFPISGKKRSALPQIEEAKAVCYDCPIKIECLNGALERRELLGVWGGELVNKGRVIENK